MRRTLALAATVAALLLPVVPAGAVVNDTVAIMVPGGDNSPVQVALRFSQATFAPGDADTALIATATTFADALASGSLQGTRPLVLTDPEELDDAVAAELARLEVTTVLLLGGTAAVSGEVASDLEDLGLDVDRVAGPTRLETAIQVAGLNPFSDEALLARAFPAPDSADPTQAFADALAAGAWAADEGLPIYLTETERLSESTREALDVRQVERVTILGGIAAVSQQAEDELEALGIEVTRVFGATRFDTAVAVARARGFDAAGDAPRVILAEGQAADAWAAGFAAAAHSAVHDAPLLLATGDVLPEESRAVLADNGQDFAVAVTDIVGPALVCAAADAACRDAREALGLPALAEVTLDAEELPSRELLTGRVAVEDPDAEVSLLGDCVAGGLLALDEDGAFAVEVRGTPGECALTVEVAFPNGSVQTEEFTLAILPAIPQVGVVVDTQTGEDRYTFVPQEAEAPVTVSYGADGAFAVDGQDATIGAFEAALTLADVVTFTPDTDEGNTHALANVDPSTLDRGVVGDVDLAEATFALVEPVSGVALRRGIAFTDADGFSVGGETVGRLGFEAALSEGDDVRLTGAGPRAFALTDRPVEGTAADVAVDAVAGVARFAVGALGDDPFTADDALFAALVARADNQEFVVDGAGAGFATFAAALTDGDEVGYRRAAGVETFVLDNAAPPATSGTATETSDPDGDPAAPQGADGGSVLLLVPPAPGQPGSRLTTVAYAAGASFTIDGAIATEAEWEAQLTAGDQVTVQPADAGTETVEQADLVNADLAGAVVDVSLAAQTYDVASEDGIVYDDLPYTQAVFGGADSYVINGQAVGLTQFEAELSAIADGERPGATVLVRALQDGTEHRLGGG